MLGKFIKVFAICFIAIITLSATSNNTDKATIESFTTVEVSGTVDNVIDGDSIIVLDKDKTQHKIRLACIDAPELAQDFGTKSKEALSALIAGKQVRVVCGHNDIYGRAVGRVYTTGSDGKEIDVNLSMVKSGYAWHFVKYAKDNKEFAEAEQTARTAKVGIWSVDTNIAPWQYRENKKTKQPITQHVGGE